MLPWHFQGHLSLICGLIHVYTEGIQVYFVPKPHTNLYKHLIYFFVISYSNAITTYTVLEPIKTYKHVHHHETAVNFRISRKEDIWKDEKDQGGRIYQDACFFGAALTKLFQQHIR